MAETVSKIIVKKNKQKKCHVVNKEAYERVNFLYQAAHLMLAESPRNVEISRFYSSTAKTVTEKLVLKVSSQVKRTICKCCQILLVPGITAKFRVRGKRERHIVATCLTCKTIKRWKCNQNKDTTPKDKDYTKMDSEENEEVIQAAPKIQKEEIS